jgi:nicotinate-nucleotide pyrophosphorylase (carboxylating)
MAFDEDIGPGDMTTSSVLAGDEIGSAQVLAKTEFIVAGMDVFKETFLFGDRDIVFAVCFEDAQIAKPGDMLVELKGNLSSILMAERVALNFFQRMCGIATLTKQYVDAVRRTNAKILDTRKTVPGMRTLDKYAVRVGGGFNHRFGLYDGILIKDNHIAAAGGITSAVSMARRRISHTIKVEVEVKNLSEIQEALYCGVDAIMLDNMSLEDMKKAVSMVSKKVLLEASGNVNLSNVKQIAQSGVDFISVGALTHSVEAADISIRIVQ